MSDTVVVIDDDDDDNSDEPNSTNDVVAFEAGKASAKADEASGNADEALQTTEETLRLVREIMDGMAVLEDTVSTHTSGMLQLIERIKEIESEDHVTDSMLARLDSLETICNELMSDTSKKVKDEEPTSSHWLTRPIGKRANA